MTQTAIWWIRRDLRLHDNQALQAALADAEFILPTFVLDPKILSADTFSPQRFAFMVGSLRQLDADLRGRGSYLIVRRGSPVQQLEKLRRETGATAIFAEEDYTPYAKRRDDAVAEVLPVRYMRGLTVRHPETVEKKAGGYYTVFTPFKKAWLAQTLPRRQELLQPPVQIATPAGIATEPLPETEPFRSGIQFPPGEREARSRLHSFSRARLFHYDERRDLMAVKGTSSLSPYLRFGLVSAREAVVATLDAIAATREDEQRDNAHVWLSELIWREFYQMILFHYPHVRRGSYRPEYDRIEWRNDEAEFAAWCEGHTGFPVVDAAMRQLVQTGWMHNRARMIVASFLTKDLLIDWRWGERFFMQHLLDGDLAANNGGWQWAAGTGTDAAPYFRIFNPFSQGKKFDAEGVYVRRYVSELAGVSDRWVQEPHLMKPMEQRLAGCVIGVDYPAPMVDHKAARLRTLAAYKAARGV